MKEVANTTCTNTHEHFDKVGAAHGEERHARFACNGFGQKRFTRTRRSNEQCALGDFTTEVGIFLRTFKELYNLLNLLLGSFLAGNVFKGDADFVSFLVHLGFAFAYAEHARATSGSATAHSTHDEYPNGDERDEWNELDKDVGEVSAFIVIESKVFDFTCLLNFSEVFFKFLGRTILYTYVWFFA